jgi:uncharacterized protein YbjT (DUF2867 family)
MSTAQLRALVVGANGWLGPKIVGALIASGVSVRGTVRSTAEPASVAALRALGVEVAVAELSDESALARACDGIDVVVSALQGIRNVIIDGQSTLLRAALKAGVKQMLPSDYGLDFFKTPEGGNRNYDLRREFDRVLDASPMRATSVLCGSFMDLVAMGQGGPDPTTGVFQVWGDLDQRGDYTSRDDLAKYLAAIVRDADAPRVVRVAGDTVSPREIAAIVQAARGRPVKIERAGSLEELDRTIARLRAADEEPTKVLPAWQRLAYARDAASGLGLLSPLDNARYPAVRPQRLREFLRAP